MSSLNAQTRRWRGVRNDVTRRVERKTAIKKIEYLIEEATYYTSLVQGTDLTWLIVQDLENEARRLVNLHKINPKEIGLSSVEDFNQVWKKKQKDSSSKTLPMRVNDFFRNASVIPILSEGTDVLEKTLLPDQTEKKP